MNKVSLLAASVAIALAGCGGSDGGSKAPVEAGGIVITGFDGYFKNAVVFDDVNQDGELNVSVDTVFGLTNSKGQISLDKDTELKGDIALQTLTPGSVTKELAQKLAALSPEADTYSDFMNTYTTDMDHEGQPMANAVVFRAPVANTKSGSEDMVISPLTDLVAIEMSKNAELSFEEAAANVSDLLGATDEQPIDPFSDFVKDAATNLASAQLHKTAQMLTESKAKDAEAYTANATDIAQTAKQTSDSLVTEENIGSDELLNTTPVIDPVKPTETPIVNYKLLVNETAKAEIEKQITALEIKENATFSTEVAISSNLFEDKFDGTIVDVKPTVTIDGEGINATLSEDGKVLTLSATELQPTLNQYTITFTAQDRATEGSEALNSLSTTFSFAVELANTAPVVDTAIQNSIQTEISANWELKQGVTFSESILVDGLFEDREGDKLTYITDIETVIPGLKSSYDTTTGKITISGNPQSAQATQKQFTIVANDGHSATRIASEPATFTLPIVAQGEITIVDSVKTELQQEISKQWSLKVNESFSETLDISALFSDNINGDVEYYAHYSENDGTPATNPIPGVEVSVDKSGLVTLSGKPTKETNGVILYVAKGIYTTGGEEHDIASEMVELLLPNVQPADETLPPVDPELGLGFTAAHFDTNKAWKMGSFADRDGEIGHAMLWGDDQGLLFCWGSANNADVEYSSNISRWDQSAYTALAQLDSLQNYVDYDKKDCWDVTLNENGTLSDGESTYEMLYQNKTAEGDYQIIVKIDGDELFWLDSTDAPFAHSLPMSDKVANGKVEFDMTVESNTVAEDGTKLYYAAGKFEYAQATYEYTSIMPEGFYTPGNLEIDASGEHEMLILEETGAESDYKTRYRYINRNFGDFYVGIKWSKDAGGTSSPDFGLYSYSQEAMEKVVSKLPLIQD